MVLESWTVSCQENVGFVKLSSSYSSSTTCLWIWERFKLCWLWLGRPTERYDTPNQPCLPPKAHMDPMTSIRNESRGVRTDLGSWVVRHASIDIHMWPWWDAEPIFCSQSCASAIKKLIKLLQQTLTLLLTAAIREFTVPAHPSSRVGLGSVKSIESSTSPWDSKKW
jgi:hypothetical protein